MNRKILVTGGTGGVGRFVVRSLLRNKYVLNLTPDEVYQSCRLAVRVLTRNEANLAAALTGEDVDWEQIECVTGSLTTKKDVAKAVDDVSGIIVARQNWCMF